MIQLLPGDCREVLATLPADSVHCVVTSPPYYGLRDYGTAQWAGGDAACDHSMAICSRDPVPPSCRQCQKCGRLSRTMWLTASSVRSECDQCGITTDYTDVASRGAWQSVKRDADGAWAVKAHRLPADLCSCGATRVDRQIGLEASPSDYLAEMVGVFREIRRVMRHDAVAFINMGDSYQDKQLLMMPARLALALQADGWWLRSDIIWHKPNPMPESVTDRPTSSHEHVFLLAKSARYFYDADAVRETADYGYSPTPQMFDGVGTATSSPMRKLGAVQQGSGGSRNLRNVWTIATAPYSAAHFATFPPALAERCIRAGTSERGCCAACGAPWGRVVEKAFRITRSGNGKAGAGAALDPSSRWAGWDNGVNDVTTTGWAASCACAADVVPAVVLDPFGGAGTTALVADRLQRDAILIELNPQYTELAMDRCRDDAPLFAEPSPPPAEPPEEARQRTLF